MPHFVALSLSSPFGTNLEHYIKLKNRKSSGLNCSLDLYISEKNSISNVTDVIQKGPLI